MGLYRLGPNGELIDARAPRRDERRGRHLDPSRSWRSTARWKRLSKQVVEEEGACLDCGHRGSIENPLTADHVIPASTRPDLRFERTNLVCRCRSCNASKGKR